MMQPEYNIALFADRRIIVIGDVMLDRFIYGQCNRISPEAPIPVIRVEREDVMLGGAGNVARNITALGATAILIGLVGDDRAGAQLRERVVAEGIEHEFVSDTRPTTEKVRYVAAQQQMLRADIEQVFPADPEPLFAAFARRLPECDAVVLSDYAKGVLTPDLLRRAIDAAQAAGKPIIADPKSADIGRYDGVTILTPNAGEAALAAGRSFDDNAGAAEVAEQLLATMPATASVLVTRGPHGMTLATRGEPAQHLPALARDVFDVSGAGDTVVATLAVALASGVDAAGATHLANAAAGRAVSKPGTAVVTADELQHELRADRAHRTDRKIVSLAEALDRVAGWRARGERIGFTNGCFDLMHPGHVSQLGQARDTCDRLIVGLNTDGSIRRLKGPSRPVQSESARAIVLASLESVDLVILFDEDTPLGMIETIRPDVLIKGKDYTVEQVVGSDIVLGYGGTVFLADLKPGHSTTNIISRLLEGVR